jgi:hypothetical protein
VGGWGGGRRKARRKRGDIIREERESAGRALCLGQQAPAAHPLQRAAIKASWFARPRLQ